jgi:hypothetical protein
MITYGKCPCNRIATLDNGWCADCRERLHIDASAPASATPVQVSAVPATVAELLGRYVAEMQAEEVIDPLAQRFTLAGVWADLARLAGEEIPAEVAAVVGAALDVTCDPLPMRGSYAEPARQFAEYTREPVYAD